MSAKVIAFLNFKGGVGKTANVVNLGASLALKHDRRVLVVDLDPQCNSTFWLLHNDEFDRYTDTNRLNEDVGRTTYQLYRDALNGSAAFKIKDAILRGVPHTKFGTELIPNLHLLPAAIDLLDIEFSVGSSAVKRFRTSLRDALLLVKDDYDYIFLDCPPNTYHVAQTALVAAQHIVVPYNPDYLSLSGLRILCQHLERLDAEMRVQRQRLQRNQVCAITINRYQKARGTFDQTIAELRGQVDLLKQRGLVHPDCVILEPFVRLDIKVAESTSEHIPVLLHAEESIGSQDYIELASSFVNHFETTL